MNGRAVVVPGEEVGHGQLVALTHPHAPAVADRSFAVTWRDGPPNLPEGVMSPLRRVPVVEGQRFNVAVADKS